MKSELVQTGGLAWNGKSRSVVTTFVCEVVRFASSFDGKRTHLSLIDQLLRSATSVGANLIEARAAHSRRDFIKFYEIALKSANETTYWLSLIRGGLDVDKEKVIELLEEAIEISKIVAAIVIKLKKTRGPLPQVREQMEDYLPF